MATTHIERCYSADVIFITVPDDALDSVVKELDRIELRSGTLLVHCSGLHTTHIFSPLSPETRAISTLSLHPLQTFASPDAGYASLSGSFCSLQGDAQALESGAAIAEDLGCRSFVLKVEHKALYHAAACMVSNYVTTLIDAASQMCADIPDAGSIFPAAFSPLLEAAVHNSAEVGTKQALTGPIVRGDSGTLAAHLHEIGNSHPELLPLYTSLAQQTIGVALLSGRLEQSKAEQMREILNIT
jgi:predicted short-subunit dehydrogenase-like oxidoreductase (DUF2520 family)